MKTIGTLGVVAIASFALLQPAQGGSRGSGHSSGHTFSSASHYSAPARHYSSRSRNFSGGSARYYHSPTRFSSQAAFRNRVYSPSGPRLSVNRTNALKPRTFSASGPRFTASHLRSQGFSSQGRVLAASSRNWDRGRDHFWHGHRCHWHNNGWVIFDYGFYPWDYPYGYYPGAYSYYDGDYYDDGSGNEYSQEPQSDYDNSNPDSILSQVQAALAKEGYYRGAIDGSLGPATRNALRRYQQSHGLAVTGRIDRPVLDALGLR